MSELQTFAVQVRVDDLPGRAGELATTLRSAAERTGGRDVSLTASADDTGLVVSFDVDARSEDQARELDTPFWTP